MALKKHSELTEQEREEYRERVSKNREKRKQNAIKNRRKNKLIWTSFLCIVLLVASYLITINISDKDTISTESSLDKGIAFVDAIMVMNRDDAEFYGLAVDNGNEAGIQHARANGIVLEEGTHVEYGATENYRLYYVKVLDGEHAGESGYVHFMDISKIE